MTQPRPRPRFPSRQLLLSAAIAVLVFLVALGSVRPFATAGSGRRLLDLRPMFGDLVVLLFAVFIGEAIVLAYFVSSYLRELRRGETLGGRANARSSFWNRLVAGLAFLGVLAALMAVVTLRKNRGFSGSFSLSPPPTLIPPSDAQAAGAPLVVHWWFVVGLTLVVVAIVVPVIVRRLRRREPRTREAPRPEQEGVLGAVDASLAALEEATDPRQAVIRAYAHMERLLSEHGLTRRPAEAPFEYLSRCLASVPSGGSAAEALTVLYELARFSPHPIDEGMRREAAAALAGLRNHLVGHPG